MTPWGSRSSRSSPTVIRSGNRQNTTPFRQLSELSASATLSLFYFSLLGHARHRHRPSMLLPVSGRSSWYPIGSTVTCTRTTPNGLFKVCSPKVELSKHRKTSAERSLATVVGDFYGAKTSMQCHADNPTPSAFHEPGRLVVLGWPEIYLVGIFLRTPRLALTNDVHAVFGFPGVLAGLQRPVRSVDMETAGGAFASMIRPVHITLAAGSLLSKLESK